MTVCMRSLRLSVAPPALFLMAALSPPLPICVCKRPAAALKKLLLLRQLVGFVVKS